MESQESGIRRPVRWLELCPWLILFRTFSLARAARTLFLAAVAVMLTYSGWWVLGWMFSGTDDPRLQDSITIHYGRQTDDGQWDRVCPWTSATRAVADYPSLPGISSPTDTRPSPAASQSTASAILEPWCAFGRLILDPGVSRTGLAYFLLCGLWATAVWAFFGATMTRPAAVFLARDQWIGWTATLAHARKKWRAYFTAPLVPLIGLLLLAIFPCLLGLLLRFDVGVAIAAVFWPFALICGFFGAILLLGLVFGWPLMWATIGTEDTDSFDAVSRSYHYLFQRPLQYLFYILVAVVFGWLGWLLVSNFAAAVIALTYGAAGWGGTPERVTLLQETIAGGGGNALNAGGRFGAVLIGFWVTGVKLLAVGFLYSYFWTAATAIYMLLRREVDATEMDEVFLDDEESDRDDLAPIGTDAAGAPEVAGDPPSGASD